MMKAAAVLTAFALCLPTLVWSALPADDGSIRSEIRRDLAEARREIRADLAEARAELETGNLDVGEGPGPDRTDGASQHGPALPRAEITPRGDFLIDGAAVAIDARQRRQLLDYRERVIDVARAGIDIGEVTALAAVDAVDRGPFSLMVGAMTGSLERRIARSVRDTVGPGMSRICDRMPALRAAQQQLAADLPAFRPYARLDAQDADTCRNDVRRGFATR